MNGVRVSYVRGAAACGLTAREIAPILGTNEAKLRRVARNHGFRFVDKRTRPKFHDLRVEAMRMAFEEPTQEMCAHFAGVCDALAGSLTYHEELDGLGLNKSARALIELLLVYPGMIREWSAISMALYQDYDISDDRRRLIRRRKAEVAKRAGHLVEISVVRGLGYSARWR